MLNEIKKSLAELGFSNNEIKVYLALTQLGEASASQVAKKSDLPRTTVISILNKLAGDGYLTTHRYKGVISYWIESPQVLMEIFNQKSDIAGRMSQLLTDLYRHDAHFPSAQIFDSKTAIYKFITKSIAMMKKNSIIYTIDSPNQGNYAKIYSAGTSDTMTAVKKKNNIITRTLVPNGSFSSIPAAKLARQEIVIREMPAGIDFTASFWLIDDYAVFFSGNPPFAVKVRHEAIVAGLKSIYGFIWSISKKME